MIRPRERDLELLGFIAEHRFVLGEHARAFLGADPGRRLRALAAAGLLDSARPLGGRSCYFATQAGMRAAGREYRVRPLRLGSLAHDAGLAWLWLAARAGTFGPLGETVTERAMRSHDRRQDRAGPPLGVRLGGEREPHYPDLIVVTSGGKRIAFELELTGKPRVRRERILTAYGADRRIDAVLYLVQNRSVGRAVQDSARRIGISNLVRVQLATGLDGHRGMAPAAARATGRRPPQAVSR